MIWLPCFPSYMSWKTFLEKKLHFHSSAIWGTQGSHIMHNKHVLFPAAPVNNIGTSATSAYTDMSSINTPSPKPYQLIYVRNTWRNCDFTVNVVEKLIKQTWHLLSKCSSHCKCDTTTQMQGKLLCAGFTLRSQVGQVILWCCQPPLGKVGADGCVTWLLPQGVMGWWTSAAVTIGLWRTSYAGVAQLPFKLWKSSKVWIPCSLLNRPTRCLGSNGCCARPVISILSFSSHLPLVSGLLSRLRGLLLLTHLYVLLSHYYIYATFKPFIPGLWRFIFFSLLLVPSCLFICSRLCTPTVPGRTL